jgi:hypothetical protein
MQKMIFSAVALLAFSFAGMANEIEEKKVEEITLRKVDNCALISAVMTNTANEEHTNATGNEWDSWTIEFVYNTYYSQCSGN